MTQFPQLTLEVYQDLAVAAVAIMAIVALRHKLLGEFITMATQVIKQVVQGKKTGVDLGIPGNDDFVGTIRHSSGQKTDGGLQLTNHRTEISFRIRIPVVKDGIEGFELVSYKQSVSCSPAGFPYVKHMSAVVAPAFQAWVDEHVLKGYDAQTMPVFDSTIDPDGPAPA